MFTTEEIESKIKQLAAEGKFDDLALFITTHSRNPLDLQLNIMMALAEAKRSGGNK